MCFPRAQPDSNCPGRVKKHWVVHWFIEKAENVESCNNNLKNKKKHWVVHWPFEKSDKRFSRTRVMHWSIGKTEKHWDWYWFIEKTHTMSSLAPSYSTDKKTLNRQFSSNATPSCLVRKMTLKFAFSKQNTWKQFHGHNFVLSWTYKLF